MVEVSKDFELEFVFFDGGEGLVGEFGGEGDEAGAGLFDLEGGFAAWRPSRCCNKGTNRRDTR